MIPLIFAEAVTDEFILKIPKAVFALPLIVKFLAPGPVMVTGSVITNSAGVKFNWIADELGKSKVISSTPERALDSCIAARKVHLFAASAQIPSPAITSSESPSSSTTKTEAGLVFKLLKSFVLFVRNLNGVFSRKLLNIEFVGESVEDFPSCKLSSAFEEANIIAPNESEAIRNRKLTKVKKEKLFLR